MVEVFQDRVSLYGPGYPTIQSVDQAGLELPSAGVKGVCRHHPVYIDFNLGSPEADESLSLKSTWFKQQSIVRP